MSNVLVKEIYSKIPIFLNPEDSLTKFFSVMEEYHVHEAFVVKNKKVLGMISYKDIIRKVSSDPSITKISSFVSIKPPVIDVNASVDDAARALFQSGLRRIPVLEKNNIIGSISISDIVAALSGSKLFRQTTLSTIATNPITVTPDTSIANARMIMRENSISHLPICEKGKIVGMVTSFDFLKVVKPHEKVGFWSMAAKLEQMLSIPVSTIMNTLPLIMSPAASISEAISEMNNKNVSYVLLEDEGKISGIVTMKDIFELYAANLSKEGVYLQITGMGNEDEFDRATVDRMVNDTISKLSKIFKVQSVVMHIKKHGEFEPIPKRVKYSVRIRLHSSVGTHSTYAVAWSLLDAVGQALDKLEKTVIEFKHTLITKQRKNQKKMKGGFV